MVLTRVVLLCQCAVVAAAAAVSNSSNFISATDPRVRWAGRTLPNTATGGVTFDFAGVSATVALNASLYSTASVYLSDSCSAGNKFNVYLTMGSVAPAIRVSTFYSTQGVTRYPLFAAAGRASFSGPTLVLRIEKAVEARFTQCSGDSALIVMGFESDAPFLPTPALARRIEFIGDSIVSGDLVLCEDTWGRHVGLPNSLWADDVGSSYASLLCAFFGADCATISWGGMGVIANDVPQWTWPLLPLIYGSTLAWEVQVGGPGAPLKYPWDMARFIPDAVVFAAGTNDSGENHFANATFSEEWSATVVSWLSSASAAYVKAGRASPPTFFLAAGGPMTDAYADAVLVAVARLNVAGVPAHSLNMTLPTPCECGHPSARDHATLAHAIAPQIQAVMGW